MSGTNWYTFGEDQIICGQTPSIVESLLEENELQ